MTTAIVSKGKSRPFEETKYQDSLVELFKETGRLQQFSEAERKNFFQNLLYRVEVKPEIESPELYDYIIREANERTTEQFPQYSYLSAVTLLKKLYKRVGKVRGFAFGQEYQDYAGFVEKMVEEGIYTNELLEAYSKEDLQAAGKLLDRSKDKLFSYAGLFLLQKNYLAKSIDKDMLNVDVEDFDPDFENFEELEQKVETVLELPQERLLTVVLFLMKDEPAHTRLTFVKEAYWALSNHYIGLATPTLTNAGRPMGTLSSCHILTLDDSLNNILDVVKDTGTFCQNGAGIGLFLGHVRAAGSWIRGHKGRATGIVGPAKIFNEIAQYVNQLNQRKGGIAVYLPLHHGDIMNFLDLRLRTGSQERRAHALFTAITIPDEFMRRLKAKGDWTVFDPYEVKKKLGFDLNYLFDKKRLKDGETPNPVDHAYTYHYRIAEKAPLQLKKTYSVRDIYEGIYRARKTGGTPYLYFSDTSARMNPNDHAGMPLGSNLCSEIIQNMTPDTYLKEELSENGQVTVVKRGDGLVTCNLSSLVLHNVFTQGVDLQRVTDIQYRMLDNVISSNRTPVLQAQFTNDQYRAVGAGQIGLATLLAEEGIAWDSWEAVEYVDRLFEKIAFANITSSHKLAVEKGSYPLFEGSKWQTGVYFEERGYQSPAWTELRRLIAKYGIRNGYVMASAPTGSNSLIMNGSPSNDALYDVVYMNKKEEMNVIIVPSNYNFRTKGLYKSAFEMDEMWSINIIASAQKHVDQGISHNMHLLRDTKASEMFRLDYAAWDKGLKTIYYTYTKGMKRNDDCKFCEG